MGPEEREIFSQDKESEGGVAGSYVDWKVT